MKKFSILVFFVLLISCSSKKQIIYLQDLDTAVKYDFKYEQYKIKTDDVLKIDIGAKTPEAALLFAPKGQLLTYTDTKESLLLNGYQVDFEGYINFPSIGKILVKNLTIEQLKNLLTNKIISNEILLDPYVDVKLLNAYFTILGEVNKPGRYDYMKNNLNLLEAIGMSGDLTINGKRDNIKIIREKFDKKIIYEVDLTSDMVVKNNFQVFSGDVIIVNPNSTRIKNAGIIGNSGTLVSLLSFILSSIIVISNR